MRVFVVLLIAASAAKAGDASVYSPCQLIDHAAELGGHTVKVRGLVDGSPLHGYTLNQGTLHNPCPGWRRRFFTSPSSVWLVWRGGYGLSLSPEELEANLAIRAMLMRRYSERLFGPLFIEVIGKVVTKPWPFVFRRADGLYFGNAFGERGAFPVLLVVQSVMRVGSEQQ